MNATLGAGLLGTLTFDERQFGWAVDLGIGLQIAATVLGNSPFNIKGVDPVTITPDDRRRAVEKVDRILASNGIHLRVESLLRDTGDIVQGVCAHVRDLKSTAAYAVLMISYTAWTQTNIVERSLMPRLLEMLRDELDGDCKDLRIASKTLTDLLVEQGSELDSPSRISHFLRRLSEPVTVLIMSADPPDPSDPDKGMYLRLGEEKRELEGAIQQTVFRNSLKVSDVPSCRVRDISWGLDRHKPVILHFSGHGNRHALVFEDDMGQPIAVNKDALADLLGDEKSLRLVILNACYSYDYAQAIADAVGCVIGMDGPILDKDSIDFSREFYSALGGGRTFEEAFKRAKRAVALTSSMQVHFLQRRTP